MEHDEPSKRGSHRQVQGKVGQVRAHQQKGSGQIMVGSVKQDKHTRGKLQSKTGTIAHYRLKMIIQT